MNPLPITTPASKEGMGQPEPNPKYTWVERSTFKQNYPPLLIIDQNNNPVKEEWTGEVTGPHWQKWDSLGKGPDWIDFQDSVSMYKTLRIPIRQVYKVSDAPENKSPITEQDRDWFNNTTEAEAFLVEHDWRKNEDIPFYKAAILLNRFRGLHPITIPAPLSDKSEVEEIIQSAQKQSRWAENFDTKQNAYLDGVLYGAVEGLRKGATDQGKLMQGEIDRLKQEMSEMVKITKAEREFITDMALNALWTDCHEKLKGSLGDIERRNTEWCLNESKRIMKKLDPTLF